MPRENLERDFLKKVRSASRKVTLASSKNAKFLKVALIKIYLISSSYYLSGIAHIGAAYPARLC